MRSLSILHCAMPVTLIGTPDLRLQIIEIFLSINFDKSKTPLTLKCLYTCTSWIQSKHFQRHSLNVTDKTTGPCPTAHDITF